MVHYGITRKGVLFTPCYPQGAPGTAVHTQDMDAVTCTGCRRLLALDMTAGR